MDLVNKCEIIDSKVTLEFINIKWTATVSSKRTAVFNVCSDFFQQKEKLEELKILDCSVVDKQESAFPAKSQINKVGGSFQKGLIGISNDADENIKQSVQSQKNIGIFGQTIGNKP